MSIGEEEEKPVRTHSGMKKSEIVKYNHSFLGY